MTIDEFNDARRQMVYVASVLSSIADGVPTLSARNVQFHCERLCESVDELMRDMNLMAPKAEPGDDQISP